MFLLDVAIEKNKIEAILSYFIIQNLTSFLQIMIAHLSSHLQRTLPYQPHHILFLTHLHLSSKLNYTDTYNEIEFTEYLHLW